MTNRNEWVNVIQPGVVYVGIVDRAQFDLIALPVTDHGTRTPDRPVLTKMAVAPSETTRDVMVVFQHWYGPTPAEKAADDAVARHRAQASLVLDTAEPTR